MDLLLELRLPAAGPGARADVRVEVDPDDTVASLVDALAGYVEQHGAPPLPREGIGLFRSGATEQLHPAQRVLDTGLVSGESVSLAAATPPDAWPAPAVPAPVTGAVQGATGLSLDIAAGPEAGRIVGLLPGATVVGRAPHCPVVIDDPTLSREHFMLQVTDDLLVWVVPNPATTNGTFIGAQQVTEPQLVEPGQLVQAGSSAFVVRLAAVEDTRRRDRLGQVPFNRVPYRRTVVTPRDLGAIPKPPDEVKGQKISLAAALTPALGGSGFALMSGNMLFLAIAGLTPLMFLYQQIANGRSGRRAYERDTVSFYERVEARAAEVDAALVAERDERLRAAPDLAELARQATYHMPRLWERNRSVDDALALRLGTGDLPSLVATPLERGGHDALRAQATQRLAHSGLVQDVPVTVNLAAEGVMGLWGEPGTVRAVGAALMAQAACLHSPEDLVVVAAVQEPDVPIFEWLKWLPHARSSTSPLEGEHLVVGPEATRTLLVNLLTVAADRSARAAGSSAPLWPRVVALVQEAAEPDRAMLSQLLDVAPALGIHLVWLGESELQVPRQCRVVVTCPGGGRAAVVRSTDPSQADRVVELDGARPETALAIARALAPLRDASAGNQTTAIPRVVPLLDAVGMDAPTPEAVSERWDRPRGYDLGFTIGMGADGPFDLDLVEQGPHTLIGGTSGAGKSELLQTLVLSLAANHPPGRLNFLFVDYKGGASSAEFRDLPHTVGYVTNLDGRLSLRALTSLRAELQRRMGLMEGRAKDLAEMLQVAPAEAPPSLVIVVDEFAALVKEVPDFVAGVVDIAQRGRSLGIHLVLATQRPTGVVNDNILANTNLRISLRVLDPADSKNIIGSKDAADIPVPLRGRAYARTGPHALMAFQCAWSGAPFAAEVQTRAISVGRFGFGSWRPPASEIGPATGEMRAIGSAPAAADAEPITHLDVLVEACAGAARVRRLPAARRPWVEPLHDVVSLGSVLDRFRDPAELTADPGRVAVLGLYDDPENQAQHVAAVDLEAAGGLMVFGTGGAGKTTLLRTVAAAMASQGSPDEVQLYGLDFASRALEPIADLPHCGAVVPGDDPERVTRLLTVLTGEIERRRDVLAAARAEHLGALRAQRGEAVFPRIVVLLDGYSAFHGTFDRADGYTWLTELQQIVSTGRQVGVHCVIATERRVGVPAALLSAISSRVALRMSSAEDLSALGVPLKVARGAELPNGRGYLDGTTEVQVACVGDDPSGVAQAEALAAAGARMAAAEASRAPELPALPERVDLDRPAERPLTAAFGLVDLSLETAELDLTRQNLAVTGPPLSGKSAALETVAWGLRESSGAGLHLAALGGAASPLAKLDLWDDAAFSRAGHAGLVERLTERLAGDEGVEAKAVLFVDAAEDLDGNDVLRPLEALVRSDALRLAVACESTTLSKAYSGWLSVLRRNRAILVLQPENRLDVDAVAGVKPALRPGQAFPPGRGVLVSNRQWTLVQVGLRPGGVAA